MADTHGSDLPQLMEGWYVLHDLYAVDWSRWRSLEVAQRSEIAAVATQWLSDAADCEKGDSAAYSVLTQKGDLMFVHYRQKPEDLNGVELSLQQTDLFDYLIPTYSHLSIIEISLDELEGTVRKKLIDQAIIPSSEDYESIFEMEMAKQKNRVHDRLFGNIPRHKYLCFYTMNKRRGEQANWYTLPTEERRKLMRSHGQISQKYLNQITQIISGSVGLDDWERAVDLHSNDVLVFKKMAFEMRFDPATAIYTEFGPLHIGIRCQPNQLPALLNGQLA